MDSGDFIPLELRDAPHPGAIVIEYLEHHGWTQIDLARRTDITPKTISEICNGKAPISPTTALAFEKVLQRPAHLWLNLQREYDEAAARRRARAQSAEWRDWAARFPLAAMKRLGFISTTTSRRPDVDDLLMYFGVSSPAAWASVWEASRVTYRQTRKFKTSEESISAWVRVTELAAENIEVASFNEERLRSSIGELRAQTLRNAATIMEPVQTICAAFGVAVVWIPELPNTGISGCARWLSNTKAIIALTLRYKTDDQMWFTFFHELGHILIHRKTRAFVLDNASDLLADEVVDPEMQRYEDEANRFAADTLIPPDALAKFIRTNPQVENDALKAFSAEIGIGPGIVVGRLQREGILKPHQGNAFKQRLSYGIEADTDPA